MHVYRQVRQTIEGGIGIIANEIPAAERYDRTGFLSFALGATREKTT